MSKRESLKVEANGNGEPPKLPLNPKSFKPELLRFIVQRQLMNNPPKEITVEWRDSKPTTITSQQLEAVRKLGPEAQRNFLNRITSIIRRSDWLLIQKPNAVLSNLQTGRKQEAKEEAQSTALLIQQIMRGPNKMLDIPTSRSVWFRY